MGSSRDTVQIDVEAVTVETDKALLCLIGGREVWVPKSQISDESDVQSKGDEGTLVIPEWLAIEKRLV